MNPNDNNDNVSQPDDEDVEGQQTDMSQPLDQIDPKSDPSAVKDPNEWTTGDEPMTASQASYLQTLSQEAGVEPSQEMTKAEASKRIEELQAQTGRGAGATEEPASNDSADTV